MRMNNSSALYSKGQLKIQQMAFVLIAFIILFGLVLMFYVSLRLSSVKVDVNELRHANAQELVRKLAGTPEFAWTSDDCASCIDIDKVFALKNRSAVYRSFWGAQVKMLRVETVYPAAQREIECVPSTYPDCNRITLIEQGAGYQTDEAFVALCRMEGQPSYTRCALGKIIMGVASA